MDSPEFKTTLGKALYLHKYSHHKNHETPRNIDLSSTTRLETEAPLRESRFRAILRLWSAILGKDYHDLLENAVTDVEKAYITSTMLGDGEQTVELVKSLLEPQQRLIIEEAENQEHVATNMQLILLGKAWKSSGERMWWMVSLLRIADEWGLNERFVTKGLLAEPEMRWDEAYEVLAIFKEISKK